MSLLKFEFTYDTTTGEFSVVNTETGEVKSVTTKKTTTTRKKKEESSEPQLILEENKYILNTAAKELLGVEEGDKIDIKYKTIKGGGSFPVIASDAVFGTKQGCKLSKNGSVSCRGSKNTELSNFGTVFSFEPYEKEGQFKLIGDKIPVEQSKGDENVSVENVDEDLTFDTDLAGLIDDVDNKAEEIDSSFFTFN